MLLKKAFRFLKMFKFFYAQRVRGFDVPDEPHLDDGAVVRLNEELSKARFYLEFGTGGSTIMAARKRIETIAVDSDRFFLRAVGRRLAAGHKVTLIDGDIGLTHAWGFPVRGSKTASRVRRWRNYIDKPFAIVKSRGRFPDFVFIDGRFRVGCALESARQAQERDATVTIMIDDYEARGGYHEVEALLGSPERAGRAALFHVRPGSHAPITKEAVADAMQNPA